MVGVELPAVLGRRKLLKVVFDSFFDSGVVGLDVQSSEATSLLELVIDAGAFLEVPDHMFFASGAVRTCRTTKRLLAGMCLNVAHKIIASVLTSEFFTALRAVVHLLALQ